MAVESIPRQREAVIFSPLINFTHPEAKGLEGRKRGRAGWIKERRAIVRSLKAKAPFLVYFSRLWFM